MSKKSWTKVGGLVASVVCKANGIGFSSEIAMILEELVALSSKSNDVIHRIEKRVNALIIGDLSTAEEYLKQLLSSNLNCSQRVSVLEKASDLFMKSHFRLKEADEHSLSAYCAGYCGLIYVVLNNFELAIDWFEKSKEQFSEHYRSIEKPLTKSQEFDRTPVGKVVSGGIILMAFGATPIGLGLFAAAGAWEHLSKNTDEYKDRMRDYHESREETLENKREIERIISSIKHQTASNEMN